MTRATEPESPTTDDPTDDVSTGEMLREVIFFAIVVGAIAGGGYGLFAGWSDWSKAVPEKKNATMIFVWGIAWALGGAVTVGVLCAVIAGLFAGLAGLLKRLVKR